MLFIKFEDIPMHARERVLVCRIDRFTHKSFPQYVEWVTEEQMVDIFGRAKYKSLQCLTWDHYEVDVSPSLSLQQYDNLERALYTAMSKLDDVRNHLAEFEGTYAFRMKVDELRDAMVNASGYINDMLSDKV